MAQAVCEQFGFFDVRGKSQLAGCLKALRQLEAAGHFELPAVTINSGAKSPRRLPGSMDSCVFITEIFTSEECLQRHRTSIPGSDNLYSSWTP